MGENIAEGIAKKAQVNAANVLLEVSGRVKNQDAKELMEDTAQEMVNKNPAKSTISTAQEMLRHDKI